MGVKSGDFPFRPWHFDKSVCAIMELPRDRIPVRWTRHFPFLSLTNSLTACFFRVSLVTNVHVPYKSRFGFYRPDALLFIVCLSPSCPPLVPHDLINLISLLQATFQTWLNGTRPVLFVYRAAKKLQFTTAGRGKFYLGGNPKNLSNLARTNWSDKSSPDDAATHFPLKQLILENWKNGMHKSRERIDRRKRENWGCVVFFLKRYNT